MVRKKDTGTLVNGLVIKKVVDVVVRLKKYAGTLVIVVIVR